MVQFDYPGLLQRVRAEGISRSPRGQETLELPLPLAVTVPAGTMAWRKGYNPALGFVEGLQILAGRTSRSALEAVAPQTVADGYFDYSNVEYGERVGRHLSGLLDELASDPSTRRAIIYPGVTGEGLRHRPCATSVQLRLLAGAAGDQVLYLMVTMRSWDLIRGLPYNLHMWGMVALALANVTGAHRAALTIYSSVPHIYVEDEHLLEAAGSGVCLKFQPPPKFIQDPEPGNGLPFSMHQMWAAADLGDLRWAQHSDKWKRRPVNWIV